MAVEVAEGEAFFRWVFHHQVVKEAVETEGHVPSPT